MKVRDYAMKFAASKRKEEQKVKRAMEVDDIQELEKLKSDMENREDEIAVTKSMARYNLEAEKQTRLFCKLNKAIKNAAQFDTLVITEKELERCETGKTHN